MIDGVAFEVPIEDEAERLFAAFQAGTLHAQADHEVRGKPAALDAERGSEDHRDSSDEDDDSIAERTDSPPTVIDEEFVDT